MGVLKMINNTTDEISAAEAIIYANKQPTINQEDTHPEEDSTNPSSSSSDEESTPPYPTETTTTAAATATLNRWIPKGRSRRPSLAHRSSLKKSSSGILASFTKRRSSSSSSDDNISGYSSHKHIVLSPAENNSNSAVPSNNQLVELQEQFKRSLHDSQQEDKDVNVQHHVQPPPSHPVPMRRPSRRPSIISSDDETSITATSAMRQRPSFRRPSCYSDEESVVPEEEEEEHIHNDLDIQKSLLNSKAMLASLSDHPTSKELDTVAALRANEYINECLFGSEVESVLDIQKWQSIPQFSKSDLLIKKHLGRGSFSDAFEVLTSIDYVESSTTSVREGGDNKLDLSMKDGLVKDKFAQDLSSSSVDKEGDDLDNEIDAMFAASTSNNGAKAVKQISGRSSSEIQPFTTSRPRRSTVDMGAASFTTANNQGNQVRKRQVTYAMKCLRPKIRSDVKRFMIGVEDLVHETALLASLDHPNIIKLHGRAICNSYQMNDGYFILLDHLQDTLEDRLERWKAKAQCRSSHSSMSTITKTQLKTAYAIADALSYLHSKNIVFRDLKPANVGFNSSGVVKLFDFGFAIGLDKEEREEGDLDGSKTQTKLLYDTCGTPRYMAPEVGLQKGYALPADVYSYGILLWEIFALKVPYTNVQTQHEFMSSVLLGGARPKINKYWPRTLKDVIRSCWSNDPGQRLTMDRVKVAVGTHVRDTSSNQKQATSLRGSFKRFIIRRISM